MGSDKMRFTLLLAIAATVISPMKAFADCTADAANLYENAKPEERVKLESPRAKALFTKSKNTLVKLNQKDCEDTLKGLRQLMGRPD